MEEVVRRAAGAQRQVLAQALARWRLHLRLQQRKRAALEVAGAHWAQMLLRRSVCGWADVAQHCRQRRLQQAVQERLRLMQVRAAGPALPGLAAHLWAPTAPSR
jgi:hypothetical protein